ncbi:hypothetical protein O181_047603 [Austropuccinia psidii MF-1]|uniref:Uncharacterized protein n=1 Tax=Austropuccinia psidii MF-1 TaxID=1389203 RepID=A0A9Q3DUA5_9BASI|nr:hypothetical protein [Austropuccinia psidii MF-1]
MIQPNPSTIVPTNQLPPPPLPLLQHIHQLHCHCSNIFFTINPTKLLPQLSQVKPNHCTQLHHISNNFIPNTDLPPLPLIKHLSDHNGSTISTIYQTSLLPPPPKSFKLESHHHSFPPWFMWFFMQY